MRRRHLGLGRPVWYVRFGMRRVRWIRLVRRRCGVHAAGGGFGLVYPRAKVDPSPMCGALRPMHARHRFILTSSRNPVTHDFPRELRHVTRNARRTKMLTRTQRAM